MSNADYIERGTGPLCPVAILSAPVDYLTTVLPYDGFSSGGTNDVTDGMAIMVDDEIMKLVSRTDTALTVTRGCADTVPAKHDDNSIVWFFQNSVGGDSIAYAATDRIGVKILAKTNSTAVPIANAFADEVEFDFRFARPYPPGQMKVNGAPWFSVTPVIDGTHPNLTLAWAHRDRVGQMDQLIDHTMASFGPEAGVTYTAFVYDVTGTLRATYENIAGATWAYTAAQAAADFAAAAGAGQKAGYIEFGAERDNLFSFQHYRVNFYLDATTGSKERAFFWFNPATGASTFAYSQPDYAAASTISGSRIVAATTLAPTGKFFADMRPDPAYSVAPAVFYTMDANGNPKPTNKTLPPFQTMAFDVAANNFLAFSAGYNVGSEARRDELRIALDGTLISTTSVIDPMGISANTWTRTMVFFAGAWRMWSLASACIYSVRNGSGTAAWTRYNTWDDTSGAATATVDSVVGALTLQAGATLVIAKLQYDANSSSTTKPQVMRMLRTTNGTNWTTAATFNLNQPIGGGIAYGYQMGRTGNSIRKIGNLVVSLRQATNAFAGAIDTFNPTTGAVVNAYFIGEQTTQMVDDGTFAFVSTINGNNPSRVYRFDPTNLTAPTHTFTAPLTADCQGCAFDGTNVWVSEAYSHRLLKLSAANLSVVANYPMSGNPGRMAFGLGSLWICIGTAVVQVSITTGAIVRTLPDTYQYVDIAIVGNNVFLWSDTQVKVFNGQTGTLLATIPISGALPRAARLTVYGSQVVVADIVKAELVFIDGATAGVTTRVPIARLQCVSGSDSGHLYVEVASLPANTGSDTFAYTGSIGSAAAPVDVFITPQLPTYQMMMRIGTAAAMYFKTGNVTHVMISDATGQNWTVRKCTIDGTPCDSDHSPTDLVGNSDGSCVLARIYTPGSGVFAMSLVKTVNGYDFTTVPAGSLVNTWNSVNHQVVGQELLRPLLSNGPLILYERQGMAAI